jgi:hypothetical protein
VCLSQDTPNKFLASSGDHVNEHVNEHKSHQELNISTIQESESLPFDPDGPIPPNFKFQMDLLDVLSKHQADLKLHDDIILVIKSHSNDQRLTFSANDLKTRYSLLKQLERNMDSAKMKPKDIVVNLAFGGQATVSIFDLEVMIFSLLNDSSLMQPKNLAQGYDVFTGKSIGRQDCYGEIHTGDAWEPACQLFCGDDIWNVPIALVLFGDKSHLDLHGSLSTLPIIFTLSCFNKESRNKAEF